MKKPKSMLENKLCEILLKNLKLVENFQINMTLLYVKKLSYSILRICH